MSSVQFLTAQTAAHLPRFVLPALLDILSVMEFANSVIFLDALSVIPLTTAKTAATILIILMQDQLVMSAIWLTVLAALLIVSAKHATNLDFYQAVLVNAPLAISTTAQVVMLHKSVTLVSSITCYTVLELEHKLFASIVLFLIVKAAPMSMFVVIVQLATSFKAMEHVSLIVQILYAVNAHNLITVVYAIQLLISMAL